MIIINWNSLVNKEFSIESEATYDEGFAQSLIFESGKERLYLKNHFVPKVYNLGLVLDDRKYVPGGIFETEYKEFKRWYERGLRYGILPFYIPRINYPYETGIYRFVPGSLNLPENGAIISVTFTVKEIG
jgi:hypothetical protein